MSPEITVVVPVYNVEKTLDRCIKSILNQSFTDYEVVLVDDGSTDSSGTICDRYVESHSNFRVIHKKNEGLGPTRNAGMKAANGKFIYHCDSDDWLEKDLLKNAYEAITNANADVCIFGYNIFTEKDGKAELYDQVDIPNGRYSNRESVRKLFAENYNNGFVVMSACNRLYRRSFIEQNNLMFPDLRRCQDMAYSLELFDKIERLVTIDDPLYGYVIEPGVYKGRSYSEMIGIYQNINERVTTQYRKWGLLDEKQKNELNNRTCEMIANYSAYAFVTKYPDQREENIQELISNEAIREMFRVYKNTKHSKFLMSFCVAMKLRSAKLIWLVSQWHERKTKG